MHADAPPLPMALDEGFVVDGIRVGAHRLDRPALSAMLASLRARHALAVLDYADSECHPNRLVAYGSGGGEAEFGILMRPVQIEGSAISVTSHLCAILARLAGQHPFAELVFAETALALRVAYGLRVERPAGPSQGLSRLQREQVATYVARELEQTFSTADLARACNISASSFTRAFRVTHGTTPRQWVIARRVQRAQVLLRDSSMNLLEVALACGFTEQSHFTRQFRKVVGVSPGAWRRRHDTAKA